jgi:hypothetical protein
MLPRCLLMIINLPVLRMGTWRQGETDGERRYERRIKEDVID